jgi:hypothetical protein
MAEILFKDVIHHKQGDYARQYAGIKLQDWAENAAGYSGVLVDSP